MHFGRTSGQPVIAGPVDEVVAAAEVGFSVHLVHTVEVTVEETVIVETVVPVSTLVVPAVVWVEVNGHVVSVVMMTTVVTGVDSAGAVVVGISTEEDEAPALLETVVAAAELDGRVTNELLDGTPMVLELPYELAEVVEAAALEAGEVSTVEEDAAAELEEEAAAELEDEVVTAAADDVDVVIPLVVVGLTMVHGRVVAGGLQSNPML